MLVSLRLAKKNAEACTTPQQAVFLQKRPLNCAFNGLAPLLAIGELGWGYEIQF